MEPVVETDFEDHTKRINITVKAPTSGEEILLTLTLSEEGFVLDAWNVPADEPSFSTYEFWENISPTEQGEQQ